MKVLITGAGGFVGRHLLNHLRATEHEVHGMGRDLKSLDLSSSQCWPLDLRDSKSVKAAVTAIEPEVIVHLAGTTSVAESWVNPQETLEVNVQGTLALIAALEPDMVRLWVNAGSCEEYAPPTPGHALNETSPLLPASPYGASKVAQEWLLSQLAEALRMDVVQFRAFNQTGPGQDTRFVVPSLAEQVLLVKCGDRSEIRVGNLTPIRDFLDVRTSSRCYFDAVEGRIPPGIYNLCSGTGRTIASILDDLCRIAGVNPTIIQDSERFRPVDVPRLVGDPTKLRSVLRLGTANTYSWERTLTDLLGDIAGRLAVDQP